jgi:hypothetical protein
MGELAHLSRIAAAETASLFVTTCSVVFPRWGTAMNFAAASPRDMLTRTGARADFDSLPGSPNGERVEYLDQCHIENASTG